MNRADEHQGCLRSKNHRRAIFDSVRTQVRDREGRIFHIGGPQLFAARTLRKLRRTRADAAKIERARIVNNRHYQTVGSVDCDSKIYLLVNYPLTFAVARVHARIFLQREHRSRQDHVGHRDSNPRRIDCAPRRERATHVHADHLHEVRNRVPARREIARANRLNASQLLASRR